MAIAEMATREVGAAAVAVQDHPQREQRGGDAALGEHEGDEQHDGGDEHADRQRPLHQLVVLACEKP